MRQFYLIWAIPQMLSAESLKQLTTTVANKSKTAFVPLGWSELAHAFSLLESHGVTRKKEIFGNGYPTKNEKEFSRQL